MSEIQVIAEILSNFGNNASYAFAFYCVISALKTFVVCATIYLVVNSVLDKAMKND